MFANQRFLIAAMVFLFSVSLFAEEQKAPVGSAAPDFILVDTNGVEFHLAEYLGDVVVLEFFDSQHGYCSTILPQLQDIHLANENVVVLGVDTRDEASFDLDETMLIFSITFPLLLQGESVAITYDMMDTGAVLIDRRGTIRARDIGVVREEFLELLTTGSV